jgi:SRSO17 transposase
MSILESPEAKELLGEAEVGADEVRGCRRRLTAFLGRYLPKFYRKEQRENAQVVIRGLLSDLERKTYEPVAYREGRTRKPIQFFVGSGLWDDEAVMGELRQHVAEELADAGGVLVLDASAFVKKGTASCGVKRQWCGRLGKVESCQVGVFMAYASSLGYGPLDRRLYLPEDWAADAERRRKCRVPEEVRYLPKWRIALDMLERHGGIAHGWVAGGDEFGRAGEFRAALRERGERYVLDVPADTLVRDLGARRPRRRKAGKGRKREVSFRRADAWAAALAPWRWERFTVRDGEKGPRAVEAAEARVATRQDGRVGPVERLVAIRSIEENPRVWYVLTNAPPEVELATVARVHAQRHRIEQVFQEAKGETGLAHYEVRRWVGWHHHMTLSLMALWFLRCEARRLGGKNPGGDRPAGAEDSLAAAS